MSSGKNSIARVPPHGLEPSICALNPNRCPRAPTVQSPILGRGPSPCRFTGSPDSALRASTDCSMFMRTPASQTITVTPEKFSSKLTSTGAFGLLNLVALSSREASAYTTGCIARSFTAR